MYKLNIGDIVVCKCSRYQLDFGILFETGKSYTITDINSIHIFVDNKGFHIKTLSEFYSFNEHFIPLKEYRKLKLEKLKTI